MINIAFYGSHNAAFAVEKDGEIVLVQEVERLVNYKNSGVAQYKTVRPHSIHHLTDFFVEYLLDTLGIEKFDNCFYLNTDVILDTVTHKLNELIPADKHIHCLHHRSHAAGAFYQSNYQEALAFSFDGGGNDGFFNIYHAKRETSVSLLETVKSPSSDSPHLFYDLGFPYMIFGHFLDPIELNAISDGNLVYSGKIMGLVSYGNVRQEWLQSFIDFYKSRPNGLDYDQKLKVLGDKIGLTFDISNRLKDQVAYDIAATSQRAFEECFLEVAKPYFDKYPNLPVIITGGCGLNIILNTRIKQEFGKEVFVGPNPNDCGIAVGMLLHNLKPKNAVDITYKGSELLDYWNLGNYIQNFPNSIFSSKVDITKLVEDISEGKIVGVARGRSEHGPRALGNRSIICNPAIKEMKDILNHKVKHREWYRPFAPVVRLEDVSEYFDWDGESRWMSFCPTVKEEWREKLPSITHIDNTARVQTVTKEQNEWLYNLLTEFKNKTGVGVLLNTSFNVAGKPILSTVQDAFEIFHKSEMDCLLIQEHYITKQ